MAPLTPYTCTWLTPGRMVICWATTVLAYLYRSASVSVSVTSASRMMAWSLGLVLVKVGGLGRSSGQLARGALDGGLHVGRGVGQGLAEVELERERRVALRRAARDERQARDLEELFFQRRGDVVGHRLRAGARVGTRDVDDRVIDRREVVHRQQLVRQDAERDDRQRQQHGHHRPADERLGEAAAFLDQLAAAGCSRPRSGAGRWPSGGCRSCCCACPASGLARQRSMAVRLGMFRPWDKGEGSARSRCRRRSGLAGVFGPWDRPGSAACPVLQRGRLPIAVHRLRHHRRRSGAGWALTLMPGASANWPLVTTASPAAIRRGSPRDRPAAGRV